MLIKAVLSAMPSYFMQTFLIPNNVLCEIEKLSRGGLHGRRQKDSSGGMGGSSQGERGREFKILKIRTKLVS